MLWWLRQEIEKGNIDVYDRGAYNCVFFKKNEKIDDIFKEKKNDREVKEFPMQEGN